MYIFIIIIIMIIMIIIIIISIIIIIYHYCFYYHQYYYYYYKYLTSVPKEFHQGNGSDRLRSSLCHPAWQGAAVGQRRDVDGGSTIKTMI